MNRYLTAIIVAILLMFILDTHARADEPVWKWGEPWDAGDITLGLVAAGTLIYDWGQTKQISKNHLAETNPVMGNNPTGAQVNRYFISVFLVEGALAAVLPSGPRKLLLGGTIAVEVEAVSNNRSLNISYRAPWR